MTRIEKLKVVTAYSFYLDKFKNAPTESERKKNEQRMIAIKIMGDILIKEWDAIANTIYEEQKKNEEKLTPGQIAYLTSKYF